MFCKKKVTAILNRLLRSAVELESNLTSVERIKEYVELPHEVNFKNLILKNR